MIDSTLHPTPRLRDVVREQIRAVGLALGREGRIAAIVIAVVTLAFAIEIARGAAAMQFEPDGFDVIGMLGLLLPFAVWKGERPFASTFLWTLPVDRRRLALAKVFAGWVWLMAAQAAFVLWQLGLAILSEVTSAQTGGWETRLTLWLAQFTAATVMYLLGSALTLGLRHPLRWVFGTVIGFFLVSGFTEALGRNEHGQWRIFTVSSAVRVAVYGQYGYQTLMKSRPALDLVSKAEGAATAWSTLPHLARWPIITFIWFIVSAAMLWIAVSRHAERRRR